MTSKIRTYVYVVRFKCQFASPSAMGTTFDTVTVDLPERIGGGYNNSEILKMFEEEILKTSDIGIVKVLEIEMFNYLGLSL